MVETCILEDAVYNISSGITKTHKDKGNFNVYGSTGIIGYSDENDYEGQKLLIARVGANAGITNIVSGKYGVSDNTLIINVKSCNDTEYIYYILKNQNLKRLVFGSGQPLITGTLLKNISFFCPEKEEQRKIAQTLSDMDNLISLLEKLIEKKKVIKQGTMQELLTGKKRLDGFSGEWETYKLDELLKYEQPTRYIVRDTEYVDQGIPVLTAGKSLVLGYTNESDGIYDNLPVIIFDDFVTSSKFVNYKFKVKSSAMKMLTLRDLKMDLRLIYELMQMIDFMPSDHQRHWISQYSQFKIKLPKTFEEQNAIASILSDMDNEIEKLEEKIEKCIKIKQGMMQELLTGKIRLL